MFVVLAFQLAFGLQLQAVAGTPVTHVSAEHCPADAGSAERFHDGYRSAGYRTTGYQATGYQATDNRQVAAIHHISGDRDCCRSSGCQCHGASSPAAFHLTGRVGLAPLITVSTLSGAQIVPTPIDEFLRPPIG
jgi:hypothetical protein